MTEPLKITCCRDLDAALFVAAFDWVRVPSTLYLFKKQGPLGGLDVFAQAAHFSTDPAASAALKERMREKGFQDVVSFHRGKDSFCAARVFHRDGRDGCGEGISDFSAYALAAASALGLVLELQEGWETR